MYNLQKHRIFYRGIFHGCANCASVECSNVEYFVTRLIFFSTEQFL